jgi:protein ImuB
MVPERVLVVEVRDWPVIAAGCSPEAPAVVVVAGRVVAASPAARAGGVCESLRRRDAQGRCPQLAVLTADPGRDARAWEPAVAAVEAFTPGVEVTGPGRMALATRGPSRYFGGDRALGQRLVVAVEAAIGQAIGQGGWAGCCRVGVADGRFAASLAAGLVSVDPLPAAERWLAGRDDDSVRVVPPDGSEAFLRPFPVAVLDRPELADLLVRLGVRTLGDLVALPPEAVLARFGTEGRVAWRLAGGLDGEPVVARTPPPELVVGAELDPPADRVDTAAFVGKALADELHARLTERGLACSRVAISAETAHGETLVRRWRHEGALSAAAVADRVRWQLEGWLAAGKTSAGLCSLHLVPEEVHPDGGRQLGFWGGSAAADERAARSLARLQGLLGPDAVVTASLAGGRGAADRVRLIPWEGRSPDERGDGGLRRRGRAVVSPPWPGRVPGPAPAAVYPSPRPADVCDDAGAAVTVTGRSSLSAPPGMLSIAGGPWTPVVAWAGPWPVEERWWDRSSRRRAARFQLVLASGDSHLVTRERGHWWVEATYD